MKTKIETFKYQIMLLFMFLFNATVALAQEEAGGGGTSKVDVSVKRTTETMTTETNYGEPWMWIVGGLAFILLLVALMRGRSSRTDVHHTTVHKDIRTSD